MRLVNILIFIGIVKAATSFKIQTDCSIGFSDVNSICFQLNSGSEAHTRPIYYDKHMEVQS